MAQPETSVSSTIQALRQVILTIVSRITCNNLCERCLAVELIYRLAGRCPQRRLPKANDSFSEVLRIMLSVEKPMKCKFCQLLADVAIEHFPLSFQIPKAVVSVYFINLTSDTSDRSVWGIAVLPEHISPPWEKRPLGYNYPPLQAERRLQEGLILPANKVKALDRGEQFALLLDPVFVDYSVLKKWIR